MIYFNSYEVGENNLQTQGFQAHEQFFFSKSADLSIAEDVSYPFLVVNSAKPRYLGSEVLKTLQMPMSQSFSTNAGQDMNVHFRN